MYGILLNEKENKKKVKVKWGKKQSDERFVRYEYSDGTELIKEDGSKAWRNNNPGNVGCSPFMQRRGMLACDDEGRAVFPDYETGEEAMRELLREGLYRSLNITDTMTRYAPPRDEDKKEINPTEEYIDFIKKETGLHPTDVKIEDMTDAEFDKFVKAIKKV